MNDIIVAILIALGAALLNTTIAYFQRLSRQICFALFFQYLSFGVMIPFVQWQMGPWFRGIIIAMMFAVPMFIIIFREKRSAAMLQLFTAFVFGALIGIVSAFMIV